MLRCSDLTVSYGRKKIVDSISLNIKEGETAILMGRSACGKSTFLKAIAGLIPFEGTIEYKGRVMMMFQKPCALPHKTVWSNLKYVATLSGASDSFVNELLDRMDLRATVDRHPHQLSGGQRQRLSLAACLLVRPRLLLLDEPFSALDYSTRYSMIELLRDIKQRFDLTYFIVTHTLDDIELLGESFYYMNSSPTTLHKFESIDELRSCMRGTIKNNKTKIDG